MSTRYNNGSHYGNHQTAADLHKGAAHAHAVGELHGEQDHLTGREHSRQELAHAPQAHVMGHEGTVGHGIASFGHGETAELALELWRARGCPEGSPDEDWHRAVVELRLRACGH